MSSLEMVTHALQLLIPGATKFSTLFCITALSVWSDQRFGAPEECSPLSKTGQTEDKVNLNGSHSPYISALCLPSDLDRTLASVQLGIAFCLTPICCLASLYPQFIFWYLELSFTLTSQFSYLYAYRWWALMVLVLVSLSDIWSHSHPTSTKFWAFGAPFPLSLYHSRNLLVLLSHSGLPPSTIPHTMIQRAFRPAFRPYFNNLIPTCTQCCWKI